MDNTVDMICQHTKEGTIIPLKIRLIDEMGRDSNIIYGDIEF